MEPLVSAKTFGLSVALLTLSLIGAQPASADVGDHCRPLIAGVHDIDTKVVYTDNRGSVEDLDIKDQNREIRAPLNSYITYIQSLADDYVAKGGDWKRECVSAQLSSWARDGALTDADVTMHGEAVRMWAIGSLALAAIKIYDCRNSPPDDVEKWFEQLSGIVLNYLNLRDQKLKEHSISNLTYWSAASLGALSVVTHRRDLWERARKIYTNAVQSIGPDGTLKAELGRGQRSSRYHEFAAQALTAIANLGPFWNEDLFAVGQNDLPRLLRLVDSFESAPQTLKVAANADQLPIDHPSWFLLLPQTGPYAELRKKEGAEQRVPRLGGSLTSMNAVLASDRPQALSQCRVGSH